MGITIQRGGGANVGVNNSSNVVYIKGSAQVDGSVRLILGNNNIPQVQSRTDGVWNLGELELSRGSLLLGREVSLSGVGHHLVVDSPVDDERHIVVSTGFNDAGSGLAHSTILGVRTNRLVVQPDDSLEQLLALHAASSTIPIKAFFHTIYFKIGATGATAPVNFEFTEGIPPNDVLLFSENFPTSVFPADTEISLDVSPGVIFPVGVQINFNVSSDNAFSMLHNAAATELWTAVDLQPITDEELVSLGVGTDRIVTIDGAVATINGDVTWL